MRSSILFILSLICLYRPGYSFIEAKADSVYIDGALVADTTIVGSFPQYNLSRDEILALPFRETQKYLSLFPGVVEQDGQLHVRGGRTGEIGYLVDGFNFTNRYTNSEFMTLIPEATEGLSLSSGVYSAQFGGGNSALASSQLRTGGEQWEFSVDYRTDDFSQVGRKFAGTTSFGYRNVVMTVGGPLPLDNLKVFLAGQHNYMRNRDVMFLSPFEFNPLSDMGDPRGAGNPMPAPIAFKENFLPNNWAENNTIQGTLLYDLKPVMLKLSGGFDANQQPNGSEWPNALARIFNQRRNPITEDRSLFLNLQTDYHISATTTCNLSASLYNRSSKRVDPDFGDAWQLYPDSIANAQKGFTGFRYRWDGPYPYSIIDNFPFNHENTPNNTYNKNTQRSWTFSGNFATRVTDSWQLKLGGNVETWTMRLFDIRRISSMMTYLYGTHGNYQKTFSSDDERRVLLSKAGAINNFGYDVDGNEVDGGFDTPREPVFRSVYVENRIGLAGFLVELGLRYEYFALGHKTIADPEQPAFNYYLDVLDETKLVDQKPSEFLLPRVAIQYRTSTNTVVHASYGVFAQAPALNQLYNGNVRISSTISPTSRGGVYLTPVGLYAKPERAIMYEIGMSTEAGKNLVLSGRVFYKEMRYMITLKKLASYNVYLNDDNGSAKGLELCVELMRTRGVAAYLNYTLSEVRGTNSTPMSSRGIVEHYPRAEYVAGLGRHPLDFNHTHNARLIIDFLNPDKEDPVFSGFGFCAVMDYRSGHNYTALTPRQYLSGSATPWDIGTNELSDPRFAVPLEPTNNSNTPIFFDIDVVISKQFAVGQANLKAYVAILNLMNTKHVLNVYPTTRSTDNDGWLQARVAEQFKSIPGYVDFYRAINLQNRWAYMGATGNDIYGSPRQIHVGISAAL